MALETYRKKRDFTVTSEPRGLKGRSSGNAFVVQKHDATRLHYDFRLELDGVLKSWAVTRGPSLVPGEKRLAVHVEDHPLDYGSFEGTIPEGQYGAGTVLVWDRGTWTPEGDPEKAYAKGHLDFTLHGEKLKGRWHLVRMHPRPGEKRENWLLIKGEDDQARGPGDPDILEEEPNSVITGRSLEDIAGDKKSRRWTSGKAAQPRVETPGSPRARAMAPVESIKSDPPAKKKRALPPVKRAPFAFSPPKGAKRKALPDFIAPMLPTLVATPPSGAQWIHEVKFDGYRIEAVVKAGKVKLRTRTGLDWADRFPTVAAAFAQLPVKDCIVDGEVVVEEANGISDFSALQNALSEGETGSMVYYAFDLMHIDGYDLTGLPLVARKEILQSLLKATPDVILRYSDHFDENGELMLQHVCRLGAEGVVSKKRESHYLSKRSTDWLKIKCANRQEFVIAGYVPSTTTRKAIGSLVLGYYENGKLRHAGRVGTGYSSKMALDLFALLSRERIEKPAFESPLSSEARRNAVWVKPDRVAEVEFRGWTADANLRQASFKGLREDKNPKDIVRERVAPMAKEAEAPATSVTFTHRDRVYWPEAGVTKQGLADYYTMVWPWIEKYLLGRPLVLLRCPNGIVQGGFFQKHPWAGIDPHILQIHDPHEKEPILGIDSFDGLMALVQSAALEIHPWGARSDDLDHPDRLIFDLDPGEGVAFAEIIAAAKEVRRRLAEAKLKSFVKTTGGKGLHVVAPLTPRATWTVAKDFCRALADSMAHDAPQLYTATATKTQRPKRIYIDYLRNARGATAVAPYSTRARPPAGISTPLTWDELDSVVSGSQFTIGNFSKRLQHLAKDPWDGFFRLRQSLPGK
ncbi:DNA ligase D [Methylovirgula ligni]|uniref:DNA ligase (ATP) n=1 Tax=Methylovirgula ligni TaxID=569860 RepID=A0A3D9Z1B9_9HYPH|nr:DNA ligase D [Methylovirgula ligni]QAY95753.1 DNA ligase D [Methylovirgula ligni]REF88871.1 ATP-dependent DNA ligase LigD phosphoesterase module /ATP-dependent DNA ligase LigD polymerase module [Methylovirgula ligni]